MFYVVALGNKGDEYAQTRHNIGQLVMDRVMECDGFSGLVDSSKYAGRIAHGSYEGVEVNVLYPNSFMNESGGPTAKFVPKGDVRRLIVVADEVDLPIGTVKVSFAKGAGGHNGIASIIRALGTNDFIRVRLGIAPTSFWTGKMKRPEGDKLPKFVLGSLTKREEGVVEDLIPIVSNILRLICGDGGVEAAMNKYNVK